MTSATTRWLQGRDKIITTDTPSLNQEDYIFEVSCFLTGTADHEFFLLFLAYTVQACRVAKHAIST